MTDDPDDTPENVSKAIRRLYRKGVSLFFSAGNEGWGMLVSKLASHPLVFAVGALTDEGEISTYSNRSPRLVSMFADGYYNERDVKGTSFSSPLLCGSCASVINRLGVNDLQLRTILKNVSPIFTVYRDSEPDGFASYQKLNESFMKIVSGSVISDETLLFDCYEVFAGRTPDKNGFDYWNGRRINGENIEDLLVEMANGMKYAGDWMNDRCTVVPKLQSLYHLFLNREADLSGIMHYVNYLQGIDNNNGTFICSDENSEN
ncbi:MAG: S8/S53 family peptidase [Candidatus Izimaplasma sp.]|nr:S8/S53 family peptidase [Candidatus Izimaplasma bacterium]